MPTAMRKSTFENIVNSDRQYSLFLKFGMEKIAAKGAALDRSRLI